MASPDSSTSHSCQTCIDFKRRTKHSGECFNASAVRLHDFGNAERMGVAHDHGCRYHAPKATKAVK